MCIACSDNIVTLAKPAQPPDVSSGLELCVVLRHKISFLGQSKVGDMVLLTSPVNPRQTLTRRLVAIEDDIVRPPGEYRFQFAEVIRRGYCWVEGENEDDFDS